jgi:hypothetical protein
MRARPRATMPFWCDMRVRVLKLLNAISAMQKARRPASCSPTHQGLVVVMAALPLFGVLVRTRYTAWPVTIMAQSGARSCFKFPAAVQRIRAALGHANGAQDSLSNGPLE